MTRRSSREKNSWAEFTYKGRPFIHAEVPKGDNAGQEFKVAKQIANRYEVKGFFASGGCGLLLFGRDTQTETEVLIKTILRYDYVHHAKCRDKSGFAEQLHRSRRQLEIERRIMVILKNQGCNAVPNPNDYVYDWNPILEGPHPTKGGHWSFDDESMLSSEPYLIMEAIEGDTVEQLLEKDMSDGIGEARALGIMRQVANILRVLHRPTRARSGGTRQLVYQDLKPANILVGAHDYVALVDMGGCRVTVDGRVSMQGAYTPGYCPRECETVEPLTPAADSYVVGSTLYHMITGRSPSEFLRSSLGTTGPKAVPHDRWDWDLLKGKCSSRTYEMVKRCLAENPKARLRDGTEVFQTIEETLSVI